MRIQNVLSALIVSTAIVTTAFAQPPRGQDGPPPHGHEGGPPRNPVLEALDQNHDHELSSEEIKNATTSLLKLDKNNDGMLNDADLGHMGPPHSGGPGGQRGQGQRGQRRPGNANESGGFAAQLLEFDENKDGKLEKDELPKRMQRMIEHNDSDGDGVLDQAELQAMDGGGRRGGEGQGGGNRQRGGGGEDDSRAERFVERAMSFDSNGDGMLSEEELTEMASNMPQRGGRGGQGGGGGGRPGGGRPQ